jgi:phosphohistidine phosphatase SixA
MKRADGSGRQHADAGRLRNGGREVGPDGTLGAVPVVLLVRHGHAGSRKDFDGDDQERPLTSKGRQQARYLASRLESFAPGRILSSPYTRCVQTAEPLAARLGLKVEKEDALAEGDGEAALALVRGFVQGDEPLATVLCTHGDVIPDVLVALAHEDHLDLGPAPRQEKGSVWILEATTGTFHKATYLPPAR